MSLNQLIQKQNMLNSPYDCYGVRQFKQNHTEILKLHRKIDRNESRRSTLANALLQANIIINNEKIQEETQRIEKRLQKFHDIDYYIYFNQFIGKISENVLLDEINNQSSEISSKIDTQIREINNANNSMNNFINSEKELTEKQLKIITDYSMMFEDYNT